MARLVAIILLSLATAASSAAAQSVALNREASQRPEHLVGAYEGVAPDNSNPPAVKVPAGAKPPQATWPGFQMLPQGGSRFFVQLTFRSETQVESRSGQFVVIFKNTQIAGRNNRHPLKTHFFNTPVKQAYLEKRGVDTALVLELRANVSPAFSVQDAATGYHFIFLDFPAGQYIEATPSSTPGVTQDQRKPQSSTSPVSGQADFPASGQAAVPASNTALSEKEMRALEEEKPPILQGKARGSVKIGR